MLCNFITPSVKGVQLMSC